MISFNWKFSLVESDKGLTWSPIFLLNLSKARVENKAEGEEEGILSEEVDQEDSVDMAVSELINRQI